MIDYDEDEMFQTAVKNSDRIEEILGYIIPDEVDPSPIFDKVFTEEECQQFAAYIRENYPPVKKARYTPYEEDFATSCRMGAIAWAEVDAGITPLAFYGRIIIIAISVLIGVFK